MSGLWREELTLSNRSNSMGFSPPHSTLQTKDRTIPFTLCCLTSHQVSQQDLCKARVVFFKGLAILPQPCAAQSHLRRSSRETISPSVAYVYACPLAASSNIKHLGRWPSSVSHATTHHALMLARTYRAALRQRQITATLSQHEWRHT
jgi:hypothetical protein